METDPNWWQLVLSYILPPLFAILGGLLSWGAARLVKKMGIDINMQQDAALRVAIRNAAAGAEEWASGKLGLPDDEEAARSGGEKMTWVVNRVRKQWGDKIPDDIEEMVMEELAQMRGIGATGNRLVGTDAEDAPPTPGDDEGLI